MPLCVRERTVTFGLLPRQHSQNRNVLLTVLIRKIVLPMVRISGLFRAALSLPLLLLGACSRIPPSNSSNALNSSLSGSPKASPNSSSKASPNSSSKASPNPAVYQPPLREIPLRTESAGVRLNEEYCIDSSPGTVTAQKRLTQSLPQLIFSVQTLLPMPVVPPKINRNLRCNG